MVDIARNEKVAVTTTSGTVAQLGEAGMHPRVSIVIRNVSPNAADSITLNFGRDVAVAGNGVVLEKGDVFTDTTSEGYVPYQGVIQAICATANGQLAIYER